MLSTLQWPRDPAGAVRCRGRGRNVDLGVECASVGVFGSIEHMKNCMDVFETWLTRIGFVALDPVDDFRGGKNAGLDAAVALLDRGFANQFLRRRGFEVGFDLGFQGRLIAFNGSRNRPCVRRSWRRFRPDNPWRRW